MINRKTIIFFLIIILSILGTLICTSYASQKIELKYMNWTLGEIPWEQTLIDEFESLHPNVKINVISKPIDIFDKQLTIAFMAGELPDVFEARPGYTSSLGSQGIMADLTPYLQEDPEYVEQFTDAGMELGRLGDKQYGVPWRGGATAVYVNNNLLEKNNIKLPSKWTWEEFVDIAEKLTDKNNNIYGFAFAGDPSDYGTAQIWLGHLFALGGVMDFENKKEILPIEEGVKTLEQYRELIDKGIVPPDSASLRYQDIVTLFGQGKVAMYVNGPWFISTTKVAFPDIDMQFAPMPMEGEVGAETSGTTLSMSPTSEYPDLAWEFIQHLTSRENLLRWGEAGQFVPPLKDTSGTKYLQEWPLNVFVQMEQLPNTQQVGNLPHAYEILRALGDNIQSVIVGKVTPLEAMNSINSEWYQIIYQ